MRLSQLIAVREHHMSISKSFALVCIDCFCISKLLLTVLSLALSHLQLSLELLACLLG